IGGAEKRFAGLWVDLKRSGDRDVHLVVPRSLFDELVRAVDLSHLASFVDQATIVEDDGQNTMRKLRVTLSWLRVRHPNAVFHFTLLPPTLIGLIRPARTVYTVAGSTLTGVNWKGMAAIGSSVALAARTDVLDEGVANMLRGLFPHKREHISVTPNSFVDLETYQPAAVKKNRLVFTGLFSREKQIDRLVDCLPELDAGLRAGGIASPEYRFMGRETRSPGVAEAVAALRPKIDVQAGYEPNPIGTLAEGKVFFSIQFTNNYPSKALLEAMACGCVPIVTDVGTTRKIARDDFAHFVPREFTAKDLLPGALAALSLSKPDFEKRVATMRQFCAQNFSLASMRAYYQGLWAQAST
ncbi:MAG: glycosyltransferase family 4 protein, partial [Archangium sp.]|nr:glycosyltransferase family 4 protein [Archangium sp.]